MWIICLSSKRWRLLNTGTLKIEWTYKYLCNSNSWKDDFFISDVFLNYQNERGPSETSLLRNKCCLVNKYTQISD